MSRHLELLRAVVEAERNHVASRGALSVAEREHSVAAKAFDDALFALKRWIRENAEGLGGANEQDH
jgi:hypothetical protein